MRLSVRVSSRRCSGACGGGSDWIEWDSVRRVRPAVDGRGNTVEVWLVQVGLDELPRFGLEPEPLIEEHD